jgi:membrane protein DedA with SNARE-associated domain
MNSLLHELTPFINQYGVLVIFFGMMVEGTTMIIATGILCYLGMIECKSAFIAAYIGALIGDQLWYFIGKKYTTALIKKFPKFQQKIKDLETKVKEKGKILSFSGRFVYGGAIIFPLSLGFYKYPYKNFLKFDALGVFLWSLAGILLGYILGTSASSFIGKIDRVWHFLLLTLLAVVSIYFLKKYLKK